MLSNRRRVATFGLASLLTGCSIVAVRPEPTASQQPPTVVCATRLAPALDTVGALLLAVGGLYANVVRHVFCETSENPRPCGSDIPAYIPAMVALTSSLYGSWAVDRCEHKLEELSKDAAQPFPAKAGP
jgi:hypothetical protein